MHPAVDGDTVESILFPILLLINFVFGVGLFSVDKGGAVGESGWGEWWCIQSVGCGGVVAGDGLNFLIVYDKGASHLWRPPHFVVFTGAVSLAHCLSRWFNVVLVGWPKIWSRGMVAICARNASWMAALLAVDDVICFAQL